MNCKNCGAPVKKHGICQYCGTDYSDDDDKKVSQPVFVDAKSGSTIEIAPDGIRIHHIEYGGAVRGVDGRLYRQSRPMPDVKQIVKNNNLDGKTKAFLEVLLGT